MSHTAPAAGLAGSGHLTARWVPVSSCRLGKKLSPNRFTKMCSFWYGNIKHRQNTRWKGVVAGGGVQAGPTFGTFHWGQQVTWLPPTHYPNILQQTTVHSFDFGNKPRRMFNAFQRFDKQWSWRLQAECVVWSYWKPYTDAKCNVCRNAGEPNQGSTRSEPKLQLHWVPTINISSHRQHFAASHLT